MPMLKMIYSCLVPLYFAAIFGAPTAVTYVTISQNTGVAQLIALLISPLVFTLVLIVVAGTLSRPHQPYIIEGRFRRDLNSLPYFHRRLYGLCWTALYYFKVIYFLILSIPPLKWLTFRLFGYRGSMDFTIYPDAWIRDLPLLNFSPGTYISNRATLGTNIVLSDGSILVGKISIGAASCIGHLTMIAAGSTIGTGVDIGVGCAIGLQTRIGNGVRIEPTCAIEHGISIGDGAVIGAMSYVGSGTQIAPSIRIPSGSLVPRRRKIRGEKDARCFISSRQPNPNPRTVADGSQKQCEETDQVSSVAAL